MSVPELRARIMELDSTEIDLQKEPRVFRKLEHDKSLVQRQLDAVLDPIARLPVEISSEIFLQSLSGSPFSHPGATHVPTLLLNICSTWSAIALSTPDLWSTIQIDFPCTDGLAALLPIWFERARNQPLSVFLRGDFSRWNHVVSSFIWRHGAQLKHLEILYDDPQSQWDSDTTIDLFGGATPEPLPLLEQLTIRCSIGRQCYVANQILELLRLAPNIVECVLSGMCTVRKSSFTTEEPVVLASLRRLTFGERDEWGDYSAGFEDTILSHLSLPALEALSLTDHSFLAADNWCRRA
ncbi:hypothetical protein B0H12DRAFT_1326074 [Mycena haematopus]|nr:hypothetical protein B0H12DRAFT_1326074 [Mycena haematopus]